MREASRHHATLIRRLAILPRFFVRDRLNLIGSIMQEALASNTIGSINWGCYEHACSVLFWGVCSIVYRYAVSQSHRSQIRLMRDKM